MERVAIAKTYKLFIGGGFPRTESGRYYQPENSKGDSLGNICLASRKDFRNAVVAARKAFSGWSTRSAFNRSQILYRIAEMLEGRRDQFVSELLKQGSTKSNAVKEVALSIDRLVYYAGWCDKYQQVFGSVNPVASAHFNFSIYEPMGVIAILASQKNPLSGLVSNIAPAIAGGNTVVILASTNQPLSAITFGEVLHASDVPAGVVNILTGSQDELLEHFSRHMDVNALIACDLEKDKTTSMKQWGADQVKRIVTRTDNWNNPSSQGAEFILDTQELKTTWHPIAQSIGTGSAY